MITQDAGVKLLQVSFCFWNNDFWNVVSIKFHPTFRATNSTKNTKYTSKTYFTLKDFYISS